MHVKPSPAKWNLQNWRKCEI